MSKADRLKVTIEGEPVCEIDIRASYLTILHALHKEHLDTYQDPYVLPGLGEGARDIVKQWFLATFGHDRHLNRWPQKMGDDYRERTGKALGKAYPIKKLRERVIEAYPVLARWGEPFEGHKLGWAELMYYESSAIRSAVFTLKHHGIASFTVHDSLIVPRHVVSFAIQCLANAYHEEAGTEAIALVVHSMDEPPRHVIGRREIKDWELEDQNEGDSDHSFAELEDEALHEQAEAAGQSTDYYYPDDDGAPNSDDRDRVSWSDPEAAYRAPAIEWLKRDMLPPGKSHYGEDNDNEDRG
jgi:hypothetical protein